VRETSKMDGLWIEGTEGNINGWRDYLRAGAELHY
jgi:hypothetical protein